MVDGVQLSLWEAKSEQIDINRKNLADCLDCSTTVTIEINIVSGGPRWGGHELVTSIK